MKRVLPYIARFTLLVAAFGFYFGVFLPGGGFINLILGSVFFALTYEVHE